MKVIFKNIENRVLLLSAFLIFGLISTVQIRTTMANNKQKAAIQINVDDLKNQLNVEKESTSSYAKRIEELKKEQESLLIAASDDKKNFLLKQQKQDLDKLSIMAGLTDVKGSGIIISLNDAQVKKNENPSFYIIHDGDIRTIINSLRIMGAQAISINNERVLAMSEQVCAGPTIRINKNKYAVPYVIKVIGNADELEKGITNSPSVQFMQKFGIRVKVDKSKDIVIPKFNVNIKNSISGLEVINK